MKKMKQKKLQKLCFTCKAFQTKYPFKITVPFYMAWFLAADQLITCIVSVFLTTAFNLAGAESICSEDTRSMINSVIQ